MGWRRDEVWLETELAWFGEQPRRRFAMPALAPSLAGEGMPAELFGPAATGLDSSRRRRDDARATRRWHLATRTVPAVALVVGSTTMLSVAALRNTAGAQEAGHLLDDPPSLTFGLDVLASRAGTVPRRITARGAALAPEADRAEIRWNRASSVGLQYAGHLHAGTQLPVEGPGWVTWNPATDSVPNAPGRLYGNERTIRAILSVLADHRLAYPDAPPVVVGDISLRSGGRMDQHLSHQNGLDVDVYYPRLDGKPRAPVDSRQVDRRLAQDLLDRFVAAGAQIVFVGYSTGLTGHETVVVPYPNHEDHMHVRFPTPAR